MTQFYSQFVIQHSTVTSGLSEVCVKSQFFVFPYFNSIEDTISNVYFQIFIEPDHKYSEKNSELLAALA